MVGEECEGFLNSKPLDLWKRPILRMPTLKYFGSNI